MAKKVKGFYRHYFKESVLDPVYQEKFKPVLVQSKEQLYFIRQEAIKSKKKIIAVDTETTGLTFFKDKIVGISFSFDAYSGFYIPLRHKVGENIVPDEEVSNFCQMFFNDFIASPDFVSLFFNAIFDIFMFAFEGAEYQKARFFEIQSLVFNADSDAPEKGLKFSARHYLGREMLDFETTLGGKASFDSISPSQGTPYAVSDACATYGLYQKLMPILSKECPVSLKLDNNMVKAFLFYLQQDVYIAKEKMQNLYSSLDTLRKEQEQEIFDFFGYHFNLDCIAPNTKIKGIEVNGTPFPDLTVEQIYNLFNQQKTITVKTPKGQKQIALMQANQQEKQIIIETDQTKIVVSPNHLFFTKDYQIKKAKDLTLQDELFGIDDQIDLTKFQELLDQITKEGNPKNINIFSALLNKSCYANLRKNVWQKTGIKDLTCSGMV